MALSIEKQEALKEIKLMANSDLLNETISYGGGDDQDIGCYTKFGQWYYNKLRDELQMRLEDWLNEK